MLLSFVRFMFPYRIFYRGVPGFATDCLCGVGCRGLTTCLLYDVGLLDVMRTRTNLSDATAVPVVTSSGDGRFEFSSTYTFMFNSSRTYSLNWRHIAMNLQHPVYYCFVNNILKHEGDILHVWSYCNVILMALSHRDEAMYISLIDFQWTSIETKSFQ